MFDRKINKYLMAAILALLPLTNIYAVKAEEVLADSASYTIIGDVSARKGSIAATIKNVASINQLKGKGFLTADNPELQQVLSDQRELSTTLYAVGLFDLFNMTEWLTPTCGEGRVFVGVLVLQAYPQLAGEAERSLLEHYYSWYSQALQAEINALMRDQIVTKVPQPPL